MLLPGKASGVKSCYNASVTRIQYAIRSNSPGGYSGCRLESKNRQISCRQNGGDASNTSSARCRDDCLFYPERQRQEHDRVVCGIAIKDDGSPNISKSGRLQ